MSKRAWIIIGAVVAVWLIGMMVVAAVAVVSVGGGAGAVDEWDEDVVRGDGPQKVVLIRVSGEIHGGESAGGLPGTQSAGAVDVISKLRQAQEDDDVVAVILRLDTPGGGVVASDEIYRAIRRLRREDTPVVASMADIAASGGYYLAAAADRVVANPATLTGSIGVIAMLPNLQEAADKLGVRTIVIKSGQFKDIGSPFREMRPEERDLFQRLIDESYTQFVDAVASGRNKSGEEIRALADGRVYSGLQAKELGLVDELGDLETAYEAALELAKLDEEESRLVEYTTGPSLENLFSPFARSPVAEAKRELGIGFGLKYLYLP